MNRIDNQGWLLGVQHCPSPNFGKRPNGAAIDLFKTRRHIIGIRAAKIGIVVSRLELGQVDAAYEVASDYMQSARENLPNR